MSATLPDVALQSLLTTAYAAARAQAGPGVNLVLLHIGAEQTGLAVGNGEEPPTFHALPLGSEHTARDHFRTTPPTPLAMENAIATVEDFVMPLRPALPRDAVLYTQDTALRQISALAGVSGNAPLSLEAMERCFDNLTAVVLGTPAARMGLPETGAFAATLLILREFMHHMQFAQLEVLSR
jgi:exopolyphosphatase/pppGpp-phosphohydrolase